MRWIICQKQKRIEKEYLLHKETPKEDLEVPNLLDLQVVSFNKFTESGIKEELKNVSPIVGFGKKYQLEFLEGYYFSEPELSFEEAKQKS